MVLKDHSAEFAGARKKKLIEKTAFDGDFAAKLPREWNTDRGAPRVDKLDLLKPGMGQGKKARFEFELFEDGPASRVEAIATDFFPRKLCPFNERRFESGSSAECRAGGASGPGADDCDVKIHGFPIKKWSRQGSECGLNRVLKTNEGAY
jgi:hypothetical protein